MQYAHDLRPLHDLKRQEHDIKRTGMTKKPDLQPNSATALASWMGNLALELELHSLNPSDLFESCGLNYSLINQPEARYKVQDTTRLWRKAVELTGDEALGLKVIRHASGATFHAVGLSVLASENLEQAFRRLSRFVDLIADAGSMTLNETDDGFFVIELAPLEGVFPADESIDGFMALLCNTGKSLGDDTLKPLRVDLRRPTPSAPFVEAFNKVFGVPVSYLQPSCRIVFDIATVRSRLKNANPFIAEHLDLASQAAIDRFKPNKSMTQQVKQWIKNHPLSGISINDVASAMNMAARTLQRKLADEGSSFAGLIDEVRQSQALHKLKHTQESIIAIAIDLGFSEPSAFSRACKRWFGKSPSEVRSNS